MGTKMICPRCHKNELTGMDALSRLDNQTMICSACGMEEAIEAFQNKGKVRNFWTEVNPISLKTSALATLWSIRLDLLATENGVMTGECESQLYYILSQMNEFWGKLRGVLGV